MAGPDLFDALRLEVNTVTGEVTLKNQYASPLTFDYYRVTSAGGALSPAALEQSRRSECAIRGSWRGRELGRARAPQTPTKWPNCISSAARRSPSIAVARSGKVVQPVDRAASDKTAISCFNMPLRAKMSLRQGFVSYMIPPPLPGDYNDNGVVDAADYVVWRNHLNTTFHLPNEVAGVSEGSVTMADFDAWKERFGNILSGSGATAGRTFGSRTASACADPDCTGFATAVDSSLHAGCVCRAFSLVFLAICVALCGQAAVRRRGHRSCWS